MPTSAVGSEPRQGSRGIAGLTLLEMLVALTIVAVAGAGLAWALRDGDEDRLDQQALRLQAQLEVARSLARATATPLRLRVLPNGYTFEGAPQADTELVGPHRWLDARMLVRLTPDPLVLGPEPMGAPLRLELALGTARRALVSDGWAPIAIE
ncbi:prepilin-type N-terminal cleavage/methylation domain-containing protein [Tepidimonas charontis]|uniref:Type II secretion system protein H n=1 Tax=Tepidimonas charontis TaxID=2267262 RepID=A0A554X6P1_9BURK|nr:type II secretion system protein H [Tepidimonas charontis]